MAKHATPDLKPTGKVSSISASRTNNTRAIVAKWKVPSSLKSTTDDAGRKRTENLVINWVVDRFRPNVAKTADLTVHKGQFSGDTTQASLNLNSFTEGSKTYTRTSFYPVTSVMVAGVTCKVLCRNRKGIASTYSSRYLIKKIPMQNVEQNA